MSRFTDVQQRILQLDGGSFQRLCDEYLSKCGYSGLVHHGMQTGTQKTTRGTPDTYFKTSDGRYIFAAYTTQRTGNAFVKIQQDVKNCLDTDKTGVTDADISEIICCHTSSNITAGQEKQLATLCESHGISFRMSGIDQISRDICDSYHTIARDHLDLTIDTEQIFGLDDLKTTIDKPGHYIFVVDDANQIAGLKHIAEFTNKRDKGYNVKVIATVREYAKEFVVREILEIVKIATVHLAALKDSEIVEIVRSALDIKHQLYLDQIVRIAEGNSRIAILAGKLAIDNQNLDSIKDVSSLYDAYYGKILDHNSRLKTDTKLLATAGILAVVRSVHLEYLDGLSAVFDSINLSGQEFRDNIRVLHELEIVDICNDKAVRFSEQCLANYFVKYVLIDKRIMPFRTVIKACFEYSEAKTIETINMLLNIFRSQQMEDTILTAVNRIWDEYLQSNSRHFRDFAAMFFLARPTETLLFLKEMIDAEVLVDFDLTTLDFEKMRNYKSIDDYIIKILAGFTDNVNYLPTALDLLFTYFIKRPDLYMEFYNAIVLRFNVTIESTISDYYTQCCVAKKLTEHSQNWTNPYICSLFICIAEEFLRLVVHQTDYLREDSIRFYSLPMQSSDETKMYHQSIWDGLKVLLLDKQYHKEVRALIEKHSFTIENDGSKELRNYDGERIEELILTGFSETDFADCLAVLKITQQFKRFEVELKNDFSDFFDNEYLIIYKLLARPSLDIEIDRDEKMQKEITEFTDGCEFGDIKRVIDACTVFPTINGGYSHAARGLELVFRNILHNSDLFLAATDYYLQVNTPLNVCSVSDLFTLFNEKQVYEFITKYNYNAKDMWIYHFLYCLPKEQITPEHTVQLCEFLEKHFVDECSEFSINDLSFIDKYEMVGHSILVMICKLILKTGELRHNYKIRCFEMMIAKYQNYIPKFIGNYELLAEIYVKTVAISNADYNGEALAAIYDVYPPILEKYIEVIANASNNYMRHEDHRYMYLWQKDDYFSIMDAVASRLCADTTNRIFSTQLENAFLNPQNDEMINNRQDKWASHFIDIYVENRKLMQCLFSAIATLHNRSRRKIHVLHFVKANKNFADFENIPIENAIQSWVGSEIPHLEMRIEFLKSLLPDLSGVDYLKHRQRVEHNIERLKIDIENAQIREMLRR